VLLRNTSQHGVVNRYIPYEAYLLITDRELALRLLVLIGESLEFLDRLRLQDLDAEFDVALGVLVARL
jgi:hypothetical protein